MIQIGAAASITLFGFVVFVILIKTLLKLDLTQLFLSEPGGGVSHTKFWGNIAYFVATIAFFVANLVLYDHFKDNLEILWLIYLSVVASNNVANKFIAYKFKSPPENEKLP